MNVKIGTEATQFLFWEHINGIFVAVRLYKPPLKNTVRKTQMLEERLFSVVKKLKWPWWSGGYKEMSSIFADQ